jgi:biotin transporter BioY
MDLDRVTSLVSRIATLIAALFVLLAGTEWLMNLFNYTILRRIYTPGRLVEFAAILMLFVITVLLRQVRDALRARKT